MRELYLTELSLVNYHEDVGELSFFITLRFHDIDDQESYVSFRKVLRALVILKRAFPINFGKSWKNEFTVYSVNSRNSYLFLVKTTPHCECPYYMVKQNNTQKLCKHVPWVYLFVLEIPKESQLINQVALLQSEVLELTSTTPTVIPLRLFKTSLTSGTFAYKSNVSSSNMPSTSSENISSGNVPKMTNDEINGLF